MTAALGQAEQHVAAAPGEADADDVAGRCRRTGSRIWSSAASPIGAPTTAGTRSAPRHQVGARGARGLLGGQAAGRVAQPVEQVVDPFLEPEVGGRLAERVESSSSAAARAPRSGGGRTGCPGRPARPWRRPTASADQQQAVRMARTRGRWRSRRRTSGSSSAATTPRRPPSPAFAGPATRCRRRACPPAMPPSTTATTCGPIVIWTCPAGAGAQLGRAATPGSRPPATSSGSVGHGCVHYRRAGDRRESETCRWPRRDRARAGTRTVTTVRRADGARSRRDEIVPLAELLATEPARGGPGGPSRLALAGWIAAGCSSRSCWSAWSATPGQPHPRRRRGAAGVRPRPDRRPGPRTGCGISRVAAVGLVSLVVAAVFAVLVFVLGPPAVEQAEEFGRELPETVEDLYTCRWSGSWLEERDAADEVARVGGGPPGPGRHRLDHRDRPQRARRGARGGDGGGGRAWRCWSTATAW